MCSSVLGFILTFFTYRVVSSLCVLAITDLMAESNVAGSPPPARSDDAILPHSNWVSIGRSNCYLKATKPKDHPIFKLAMDILRQTSFFPAFTTSTTVPSIYIQQFWNTISFDRAINSYRCQLDEQWVNITKETLASALRIMPTGDNIVYTTPTKYRGPT